MIRLPAEACATALPEVAAGRIGMAHLDAGRQAGAAVTVL